MTPRDSDPSPAVDPERPGATPPTPSELPSADRNPLPDAQGPTGVKRISVVVPPPMPNSRRAAVVVPPPTFGSSRQDPQQPSPFSIRKVVLATAPTDAVAGDDDVAARQPAPSNPQTTAPTASEEGAEADPDAESTHETASPGAPRAAIVNGLRWNMIGRPAIETANLFGVAVLARLVAPAEFGRYAIALIVLLLANVPTQAVQYTIVQRDRIDRDHLKTGLTLTVVMGLAVCALCLAASYTVVPTLFDAQTAILVRLAIPACFINSVNTVQIAIITRRLEFRRLSLLDMTITLAGMSVAITLAAIGLGGEGMVLGLIAGGLAGFILVCFWVLPPIPNFRLRSAQDLLRSGLHAASGTAGMVCFQNCDYVIVGARLGALQAGYYFRAYTLGVVYQTKVSQVMTSLGFPVLSRVTSEEEVHHLRRRMVHIITLILFPLLTALAIVAPRFVTWFYGPAWQASVVPVQILAFGGAAMLVAEAVIVAMLATGRARAVMWWNWGHFLVYGAAVFAVARLGLTAIALAAVVVHTTFLIVSYIQLHRGHLRQAFTTLTQDLLPAAACSLALAAVALPISVLASKLGVPMLPYLLIIALAGGAGYFVSLRLWFPNELRQLSLVAGRLLPGRAHRLFGRLIVRPQPQSAA
jgi:O-antigen/teichoic acid export membrane protein